LTSEQAERFQRGEVVSKDSRNREHNELKVTAEMVRERFGKEGEVFIFDNASVDLFDLREREQAIERIAGCLLRNNSVLFFYYNADTNQVQKILTVSRQAIGDPGIKRQLNRVVFEFPIRVATVQLEFTALTDSAEISERERFDRWWATNTNDRKASTLVRRGPEEKTIDKS
jgi:hypothetical protein